MISNYADALRVMHQMGSDSEQLASALLALGIVYRESDETEDENKSFQNVDAAKRKDFEPDIIDVDDELKNDSLSSVTEKHFPVLLCWSRRRQNTENQPSLEELVSYEPLPPEHDLAPLSPNPLWNASDVSQRLLPLLQQNALGNVIDNRRLVRDVARRIPFECVPFQQRRVLPADAWIYADYRGRRCVYREDVKQLYELLSRHFGAVGISGVIELFEKNDDEYRWRQWNPRSEIVLPESAPLPLPNDNDLCLLVSDTPDRMLIEALRERECSVVVLPFSVLHAQRFGDGVFYKQPVLDHEAETLLCALSLTPLRFSLALVRDLREKLTKAGPELEYRVLYGSGIQWFLGRNLGAWRFGFEFYQEKVRHWSSEMAQRAHKIIEQHCEHLCTSVLFEYYVLALTWMPDGWPEDSRVKAEAYVNHYCRSVNRTLYEQQNRASEEYFLERALCFSGQYSRFPKAYLDMVTFANHQWKKRTGKTDQLPHLDMKLFANLEAGASVPRKPGALRVKGDRFSVQSAEAGPWGVVVAELSDVQTVTGLLLDQKPGQAAVISALAKTSTVETVGEVLELKRVESDFFYWASAVSVTDAGVLAETEAFEVFWPSVGEHEGADIRIRETSPEWMSVLGQLSEHTVAIDEYGLRLEFEVLGQPLVFRYIPPGSFLMGSPEDEPERNSLNEKPLDEQQHVVTLTQGFWLGETAVSQSLWLAIMKENPSEFSPDNNTEYTLEHPVENVRWQDCQQFIAKLNEFLSLDSISLPTEAQWEYACRAGTKTPFYTGVQLTTEQANYDGNYPYNGGAKGIYFEHTLPVKTFDPNPWGLYQMSGNVWEWCLDGLREYGSDAVEDPVGSLDTDERVLRGGSWRNSARHCRSADRVAYDSARRDGDGIGGFRLAMVQTQVGKQSQQGAPLERPGGAGRRQRSGLRNKKK